MLSSKRNNSNSDRLTGELKLSAEKLEAAAKKFKQLGSTNVLVLLSLANYSLRSL
jgi:hypothetical protein